MTIQTESITLGHKEGVEALRRQYGHLLSSHAFTSLYLWRKQMGLSLLLTGEMFTVRCCWQGLNAWFFPCGSEEAKADFVERGWRETDFSLHYLREEDVAWLERRFPGRWRCQRVPDADEYLYDVAGHRALKGNAYANMRTQVHKVEREYDASVRMLDDETAGDAMDVLRRWSYSHDRYASSGLHDDGVDEEALQMRRELGVTGCILYLGGRPTAVTAGFPLGGDLFDMIVAKSTSTAQGVSYYAKRELFLRIPEATVNLEEDLGIPGLRKMKQGMNPSAKFEIWEARPVWSE